MDILKIVGNKEINNQTVPVRKRSGEENLGYDI